MLKINTKFLEGTDKKNQTKINLCIKIKLYTYTF